MKKLLLIIGLIFTAPLYAVADNEATQVNKITIKPAEPRYNYPKPAYYENGRPVYGEIKKKPKKCAKDEYKDKDSGKCLNINDKK